jgi:hypothetical protein
VQWGVQALFVIAGVHTKPNDGVMCVAVCMDGGWPAPCLLCCTKAMMTMPPACRWYRRLGESWQHSSTPLTSSRASCRSC